MKAMIHEKSQRGKTLTGWLTSHHTFSFGGFSDPSRMGHRALRVLNDDVVIPGAGFGQHAHDEMDIVTYVISGALKHQDSMGNTSVIRAGEFGGVRGRSNHRRLLDAHRHQIILAVDEEVCGYAHWQLSGPNNVLYHTVGYVHPKRANVL